MIYDSRIFLVVASSLNVVEWIEYDLMKDGAVAGEKDETVEKPDGTARRSWGVTVSR